MKTTRKKNGIGAREGNFISITPHAAKNQKAIVQDKTVLLAAGVNIHQVHCCAVYEEKVSGRCNRIREMACSKKMR